MLNLKVVLPGHAISANALYKRNRNGGVFLSDEAVTYRARARPLVEDAMKGSGMYQGGQVTVKITAYDNFYTQAGLIRDVDIDNSIKNILDSIFPVIGVRDKVVFDVRAVKKHSPTGVPRCVVTLIEQR